MWASSVPLWLSLNPDKNKEAGVAGRGEDKKWVLTGHKYLLNLNN